MKTENLHTLVGAGVVATSLILGSLWLGSEKTTKVEEGYHLTATFSKIDGVNVGSEVLLAGIPVGVVVAEEMNPHNHQVTLTLKMNEDIEIPIDSGAEITSGGIFGAKYISVNVGGEFDVLQDGDAFEFIRDSVIFEEVFERVIEIGEAGYNKRKEAAVKLPKDGATANPFATDSLLLDGDLDNLDSNTENAGDNPFEENLFEDLSEDDVFADDSLDETETNNESATTDEGEGPV